MPQMVRLLLRQRSDHRLADHLGGFLMLTVGAIKLSLSPNKADPGCGGGRPPWVGLEIQYIGSIVHGHLMT